MKKFLKFILIAALLALGLFAFISFRNHAPGIDPEPPVTENAIREDGIYTSKEDVALYLYTYQKLPRNFVTKDKAKEMGWKSSEGNLQKVCDSCSIGGDRFGNREGKLPKKDGRVYYECDIDYHGGSRNGKRIVYSNDGLIYYTDDHYNTFELLYGEEE